MSVFGWILFVVGFVLLIIGGVGLDGIGNIPSLQVGGAMMISGSVFISVFTLVEKAQLISQATALTAENAHLTWQAAALTTEERDLGIVATSDGNYRVSSVLQHFDYKNIGDAIRKAKTTNKLVDRERGTRPGSRKSPTVGA